METAFQVGSIAIVLGAPLANSNGVLDFAPLDNLVIRLALILLVLASTKLSPLTALLTMLAVFTLFMERNFRILSSLPNQQPHFPDSRQGVPVKANPLPAIKETISYSDHESDGLAIPETHGSEAGITEKYFEEASDLQDSNPRLPEGPLNRGAIPFYKSNDLL